MKNYKIAVAILIVILGATLMISKLYDKSDIQVEEETTTTEEVVPTDTTTTTTKKTTKKTTRKTTKKVYVATNTTKATASKQTYIDYAKSYGNLNNTQLNCLIYLWDHESGWNPNNKNKSSGACGIPQAYPCKKIKQQQGSDDWQAQIRWGLNYINYRYKNPCQAWNHFKNKKWY